MFWPSWQRILKKMASLPRTVGVTAIWINLNNIVSYSATYFLRINLPRKFVQRPHTKIFRYQLHTQRVYVLHAVQGTHINACSFQPTTCNGMSHEIVLRPETVSILGGYVMVTSRQSCLISSEIWTVGRECQHLFFQELNVMVSIGGARRWQF